MTAFLGRYYSDQIPAATMNAVEGRLTLTITATDNLGNVSTTTTHFTIDSAAPTATITPASASTWRTSGAVTITGSDAYGVASVSYRVDANSGPFTTVAGNPATFTLPNGAHTVDYFVTDLAGKTSTQVDNAQINVDTAAPLITNVEPVNGASSGWAAMDCTVASAGAGRICATVTDAGGSVLVAPTLTLVRQSDNRCWDGSDFGQTTCSTPVTMSLLSGSVYRTPTQLSRAASGANNFIDGTYVLTITAKDNAGNTTTSCDVHRWRRLKGPSDDPGPARPWPLRVVPPPRGQTRPDVRRIRGSFRERAQPRSGPILTGAHGEHHDSKATGLASNRRTMVALWLLLVGALAGAAACLVTDRSGAHLQLAPVFLGVALAVAALWLLRSRSRRGRG